MAGWSGRRWVAVAVVAASRSEKMWVTVGVDVEGWSGRRWVDVGVVVAGRSRWRSMAIVVVVAGRADSSLIVVGVVVEGRQFTRSAFKERSQTYEGGPLLKRCRRGEGRGIWARKGSGENRMEQCRICTLLGLRKHCSNTTQRQTRRPRA